MVFLKVGDKQVHVVQAKRYQGKYFMLNDGIYELDGEYENRMSGQSFYIHNQSNAKPISLEGVEELQTMYREGKMKELYEATERVYNAIEKASEKEGFNSPIKALKELEEGQSNSKITPQTQKFLVDHKFFDKSDLKLQNLERMTEKRINSKLSYRVMTFGPIGFLCLVGGGILGFMTLVNPIKLIPALGNAIIYTDFILGLFK